MNRAELKQIAHGLKQSRPNMVLTSDIPSMLQASRRQWIETVESVARALELKDQALSNFYAAAGYIHAS